MFASPLARSFDNGLNTVFLPSQDAPSFAKTRVTGRQDLHQLERSVELNIADIDFCRPVLDSAPE